MTQGLLCLLHRILLINFLLIWNLPPLFIYKRSCCILSGSSLKSSSIGCNSAFLWLFPNNLRNWHFISITKLLFFLTKFLLWLIISNSFWPLHQIDLIKHLPFSLTIPIIHNLNNKNNEQNQANSHKNINKIRKNRRQIKGTNTNSMNKSTNNKKDKCSSRIIKKMIHNISKSNNKKNTNKSK